MKTLDDFNLRGKRILIRVDLNSSIINNKIQNSLRFKEHGKTLKELIKRRAKIVVIAHQGEKGKSNYLENMKQHSRILSKAIRKKVVYINDLFGKRAVESIKNMKEKEVILLKNTRSWSGETKKISAKKHSQGKFVQNLKNLFDLYVEDALSVCHRNHASIVGFPYLMQSCAGRVLEKELNAINKVNKNIKKPLTLILGGKKIEDYQEVIKSYVKQKKVKYILTAGYLCLLALILKGKKLGAHEKLLKEQKKLKLIKGLEPYKTRFILPLDLAIDVNGKRKEISIDKLPSKYLLLDLGKKTIQEYTKIIKISKTIFIKGTAGNYEKRGFEIGTKRLLKEIGKSKAFSLVGGGDTLTALEKFKIKGINHISLSGGALLKYLSGKKLPGIEILKKQNV